MISVGELLDGVGLGMGLSTEGSCVLFAVRGRAAGIGFLLDEAVRRCVAGVGVSSMSLDKGELSGTMRRPWARLPYRSDQAQRVIEVRLRAGDEPWSMWVNATTGIPKTTTSQNRFTKSAEVVTGASFRAGLCAVRSRALSVASRPGSSCGAVVGVGHVHEVKTGTVVVSPRTTNTPRNPVQSCGSGWGG